MKIFISWSGESSQAAAEALAEALPEILQPLKPFISVDDLRKGGRWQAELSDVLQSTSVGIICMTRSNLEAPWVLFEAGALSKVVAESCVMPLLIGLSPSDIRPPLSQFNVTRFERADFFRLVKSLNDLLPPDQMLIERRLTKSFDQAWPDIEARIADIATKEEFAVRSVGGPIEDPMKKINESVEEILAFVRSQAAAPHTHDPGRDSLAARMELFKLQAERARELTSGAVTIDLSSGILADLEKKRRAVLTALYQLDQIASGSNSPVIKNIAKVLRSSIEPIFNKFLGADELVAEQAKRAAMEAANSEQSSSKPVNPFN